MTSFSVSNDLSNGGDFTSTLIAEKLNKCYDAGEDVLYAFATHTDNEYGEEETERFAVDKFSQFGKYRIFSNYRKVLLFFDSIIVSVTYSGTIGRYYITGYGNKKLQDYIVSLKDPERPKDVTLTWAYSNERGEQRNKDFTIKEAHVVYDEFVPFIKDGVETYIDNFLKSKSSILILLGPPGTGKTSFIRHMLFTRKLNAIVTFDEKIMTSDQYYIEHLSSKQNDIMVIEDADIILSSRQEGQNRLMTKLLNVSDGLVPLLNKKIIFSTNLDSISKIDDALMRPGRCFDTVTFRQLSYEESMKVCEKANLDPVCPRNKEYTLSEIFNGKNNTQKVRRIGLF